MTKKTKESPSFASLFSFFFFLLLSSFSSFSFSFSPRCYSLSYLLLLYYSFLNLPPFLLLLSHPPFRFVIEGVVYDVTKFLDEHPGGDDVLVEGLCCVSFKKFSNSCYIILLLSVILFLFTCVIVRLLCFLSSSFFFFFCHCAFDLRRHFQRCLSCVFCVLK